ncbi:MAG: PEGA domain-containing protein, partial [Candidatus Scalindua sp.]|nr:PEGA domain-containing protein [Candidatus Scalindua sp.]
MESNTPKSYRHCPGENYEISIFICRGRQKAHYPKCPTCEFRTKTDETSPTPAEKETKEPPPPRQLNTGSIVVKSKPPSAVIYLDGDNIGVTPAIITQILPGQYKVKIKMDGYDSWNESVDVKANKETSLTAILQGKDGSIAIQSEPTNAMIFIDGNKVGTTPETINNVQSGKYFIEVKLDGYEIWGNEINIEAEKETSITAELTTEYGSIILGSEPTKSKIFLDGIEIGTTPANLRSVPHGTHLIEVRKDGYSVWEKSVNIAPGKEKVFTAMLQVKTGSVSIKSVPKNAKIFIDEKHVGTTPESIMSIIPGTHEIKVQMDKYDIWSETVNIEAGKENVITAVLQRSTGSLMVESDPANATIFFDGKEIGTTPEIVMSSAKGTHTVEVRMKGYDLWKREVDIEPGTENSLTAILQLKTGYLNIKSKPSGAIIFINDEEAGPAPKTITKLLPGTYKIEVKMDGYKSCCENVEVNADKQNQLDAVLQILTGSLNIKSEPSNAAIIVDGNEVGNTPANITDLVPGKHLVKISMEGYENWSESLELSPDKKNQITAILQQLTGSLNIKSKPSNATIIVDGNEVGNTPANIPDLEPGKHLVEISMEGYENWSESVEVSPDKENQITAVLQQLTGSLNIKSKPSNATIIVDGNEVGNTPSNITDILPGKHLVKISMEGYENWSDNVEISPDKENQVTAVLQQLTCSLNIKSEPSNAVIIIDGNEVGNTPANIADLIPGKHLVQIKMDGYRNWKESLDIVQEKVTALTAVLQIIPGSFSITSEPSDAAIFIDGKDAGNTPLIITDPDQGKHHIEVKMEGYENWSESVNIEHNKETTLTAALQLKAGSICIKSEPSIAVVLIDGEEVGTTPLIIADPTPGIHNVEVKMSGFETWSESVKIETGKEATLTAVLQLKPGPVTINSVPSDATILINGKEIGTTPVNITDPDPGAYLVEVRMDGYETWNESIDIKPGKEITITADLKIKAGSINVTSNPSDAVIHIDSKNIGNTPETITDLIPGMHLVEVKMEGYEIWSENVEVKGDKKNTLTAILLEITGSLNICSNPSNAIIRIGGKEAGNTPAIIANLGAGKYIVEVSMDGYEMWSDSVNINPGKETAITAELETKTGSVSIKSEPSNAMVLIDGKRAGSTPEMLTDIKLGMHLVEVKMEGFETWCDSVNINPGKEIAVTAKLQIKAGSVTIKSNPSEATILLDSKDVGTTPKIISDLSPEKHLVEVRMDGYESWSKSIDIEPAMKAELTAELHMKVGRVNINSEPSNAIVLMDGKKVGTTPEILTDIKPGEHILEVRTKGFDTWSESVDVRGDKENVIAAVLKETIGSISIKSNLSGAVIYLDGKEVGTTPDTITSVSTGIHVIEVKMEGYAEWTKKINIKKGEEITLNAMLQSITGTVSLESEPTEAIILLDGEDVGKSPKTVTGIKTGKHELEVRMDGYVSWVKMIKVKAGKEYAFTAVLQRRRGSLMITSDPSNATIYIQDKKIGKSPKTVTELIPGNYTVEVKHDEYQTWSDNIEIVSDKEADLKAVLQAKPGSISIKSKPSDAKILVDGNESGTTPETINDIKCGTHIVELKVEGYEIWSENVEVKPNKESSLTAVLQEITGSISIKSDPPNAMILMDGKKAGTTPAIIKYLSLTTHTITISIDGYNVWSESVEVEAEKEKELTAKLLEIRGTVNINSRPSGALIHIDGKEAGTTPQTITDLTAGMHMVEASMEGYEHWNENIKVIVGKEYTMTAALQEIAGTIDIKSEPSNATILVNGKETGSTPETIKDLKPGMYQVEVRMDGFENWSNSVEVASGKESKLTVALQQLTCSVNISSEPSDATILIDNSERGTTPQTIKGLSLGTHKIEVRMTGYEDWNENITVKTDKDNTVNALLQKITGSINIQSDPSNATILIDGNKAGTTPATIKDLSPGTHMVDISMEGHAEWRESVEIISGEKIDLTATLQMEVGSLDIKSKPSGAIVLLDSNEVGTTPAALSSIPVGPHEIKIKIDGYEDWKRSIIIKKGKVNSLNATLQLNIGSISIESYPEKAKIILDGKEIGKAPKQLTDIIVGTHEVVVLMDGYVTWK